MKIFYFTVLVFFLFRFYPSAQTIEEDKEWVTLKNKYQTLSFNLNKGLFYILDKDGRKVIDYAYFQSGGLQSKEKNAKLSYRATSVKDELGKGTCLTIQAGFEDYSDIIWQATLYDGKDFIVFNMGLVNDTDSSFRLNTFYPLISKNVFKGLDNKEFKVLDGNGGGGNTRVRTTPHSTVSFNNLLLRFGQPDSLNILVAGGLTYNEFEKFVKLQKTPDNFSLFIFSEDPVGKLVDPHQQYLPNEKFYLCINDKNPFTALEKYGQTVKTAQQIELNMYDFPTECLWYASFYNNEKGRRKFNDSQGAVEEMDNAIKSGITRYSRVAIRLVPDTYTDNNQQGWWDDKHWGMYGEPMSTDGPHHTASFPTSKSWAQNLLLKGGIPITYFQSGRRSEDYAQTYPQHMLFNDKYRGINMPERFLHRIEASPEYGEGYYNHWWKDKMQWSYDFTDPGFTAHMKQVYKNLKEAGIKGIMYDYPEITAWAFEGGFEDKYATTAWAYRNMYKLAYDGLGKHCYLDERCLLRGSEITLGLVASQRVWADTDEITPEMVTRCGLRWYKNRVIVNYDMDAKDPEEDINSANQDFRRAMFTMCYVTSGRLLLGRSFNQLSKNQLYDLGRTLPYHTTPQSARPLDAFNDSTNYPRIYDFEVNPQWHQLTFYNYNTDSTQPRLNDIAVSLGRSQNEGGMQLDTTKSYYVYDFWNNEFIGKFKGTQTLCQTLRPGEARMMSVHTATTIPQVISTNRHVMQGYLDLKDVKWDERKKTLTGTSEVIGGEPYDIIIAANGRNITSFEVEGGRGTHQTIHPEETIKKVTFVCPQSKTTRWTVRFK